MFELHFEKIELKNVFLRKAQLNQMRRVKAAPSLLPRLLAWFLPCHKALRFQSKLGHLNFCQKYEEANIFPFVESNASLEVFEEKKQKQQILAKTEKELNTFKLLDAITFLPFAKLRA